MMQQVVAKMQAMLAMGEIMQQASQRLPEGWTRGLTREQMKEVLAQKYNEELLAKLQDLRSKTAEDWEALRFIYLELIKWSKLPDRENWLELYNKPMQSTNLIEGEEHASQTEEHP